MELVKGGFTHFGKLAEFGVSGVGQRPPCGRGQAPRPAVIVARAALASTLR